MRREGWEERIFEELERHRHLPAQYGVSDCFRMAMDVAQACLDRPLDYNLQYSSPLDAARLMKTRGWADVGDAFASYFNEIPPAFASRGDIGIIEWDGEKCGVVVIGNDVIGKHVIKGTARLPRSALLRAYRVE